MGDYIERQAVLDAIWPVDPENDGSDGCTVVLQSQSFTSADIEALVNDIPAANVRPVVHEKWEIVTGSNGKEYMVCTNCRVTQNLTALFTFCPNCGAQMDGGDSNG